MIVIRVMMLIRKIVIVIKMRARMMVTVALAAS